MRHEKRSIAANFLHNLTGPSGLLLFRRQRINRFPLFMKSLCKPLSEELDHVIIPHTKFLSFQDSQYAIIKSVDSKVASKLSSRIRFLASETHCEKSVYAFT